MASIDFINECKNYAYENRYGKLSIINGPELNQSNAIQEFTIDSGCYNDGTIIGTVYCKKINTQLIDVLDETLENASFLTQVGVKYSDNTTEYINLGKFTIEKPKDELIENYTSFTAYDDLANNIDKVYVSHIDYTTAKTLGDLYEDVCINLGLIPKTLSFLNSNIPITNNPFGNKETNRLVLETICKIAASFVEIDAENNKIDLVWLSTNNNPDYTFQKNDYSTINGGKIIYGPVNSLVIRSESVESENVSVSDSQSIEDNGEHLIVISDDYILNTPQLRQQALSGIWQRVHNLEYVDCELSTSTGKPFLPIGAKIRVYTDDEVYFDTYVLQHQFTFDGAFRSVIKSPALTDQQIAIKQDISMKEKLNQTAINVDKQNQQIQSIVSQIGDRGTKTTTITQDIDGLIAQVQDMPTITTESSGTGSTELSNLIKTRMIELRIYPTNQDITKLVISPSLKISSSLIMLGRTITFEGEETFKYKIPKNLYYYNNDIHDEFVYDGVNKRIYIIHRVSVDTSGNKSVLATPIEEDFEYYDMIIGDGNNDIYMANYPTAHIYAKAMIKNDYTSSFATSYEVDSKIELKANEINNEVRQKVDENEVIAKFNLGIRNNQGVVQLIGNSVIIDSDNFDLDEHGNVNMRGGNIYLGEGSQILGDDGLISTILVQSNICSSSFVGGSTLLPMGFSDAGSSFVKDWLALEFDIPQDFIIKSAKIILTHVPVNYTGGINTTGYSRNLKLFKSNDGVNQPITLNTTYYFFENTDVGYEEITGAFGENGFTGHSSYGEEKLSIELKDYITTGFNKFKIQSMATTPTTYLQSYQYSGACMATLYITGYSNFEENIVMPVSLLLGTNEQDNNNETEEILENNSGENNEEIIENNNAEISEESDI